MHKLLYLLLGFSAFSSSQSELTSEQRINGEIYANYVSYKSFVSVCDGLEQSNQYQALFEKWVEGNKSKIDSGYEILKRHYEHQDLDVDEVFSWKTNAELKAHSEDSTELKTKSCGRLKSLISEQN